MLKIFQHLIINVFLIGKKVIFFENGGSASYAQHLAAELSFKYYIDRAPRPAIELLSNISAVTAIANDYSYKEVFRRQLEAFTDFTERDDIVIVTSMSGNSSNVINANKLAKQIGIYYNFFHRVIW